MARLTKKQIDENIEEIKRLEADIKNYKELQDKIDARLRKLVKKEAWVKEIFKGFRWMMVKTPVNKGKNTYNMEVLKPFLAGIPGAMEKVIKKEKVIIAEQLDVKELEKLVKQNLLPEVVLDRARIDDWTFRIDYKGIADEQNKTTTKKGA
jgi:hypothetical protein